MTMCEYCDDKGEIETDNNGPIVKCPVCEYDYEQDSTPWSKGGDTLCGKLGRKHKMKRFSPMSTRCVYPGCEAFC